MTTKDTGGPAFPYEYKFGDGTAKRAEGMTLRDYFAAKAMQGLLTGCSDPDHVSFAKWCYEIADAMLAERNK